MDTPFVGWFPLPCPSLESVPAVPGVLDASLGMGHAEKSWSVHGTSQLLWICVWRPFVSARANCVLCWQTPLILLAAVVSAQLRDVRGHCREGAGEIFQVHRFLRTAEFYWNLTLVLFDDPGFVKCIQEGIWMMLLCH